MRGLLVASASSVCYAQLFLASQADLQLDVPVYLFHSPLNQDFALLREAPREGDVVDATSYTLFDTEPVGFVCDGVCAGDQGTGVELKSYWSASRLDIQTTDWSLEELNSHGGNYVALSTLGGIVGTNVSHYISGAPLTPLWTVYSDSREDAIASPFNAADANAVVPGGPFRATGRQLGFVRQGRCARCNIGLSETFPSAGGADCMNSCAPGTSSFNSIYHVGRDEMAASAAGRAFNAAMTSAGSVITGLDSTAHTQSGSSLHMSFNYFCCYTDADKATIKTVLSNIEWPRLNITYGKPAWRIDNRPDHFSIIVLLDDESNERMMDWVGKVEATIESAGVPIHIPRSQKEPFHSTLGVVKGSTFPMEQALVGIDAIVPAGTWTGTVPLEITKPQW